MDRTSIALFEWESMEKERVTDVIARRLVVGERSLLAQVFLDRGAVVPSHVHDHEQLTTVMRGRLRFWLGEADGELIDVGPGQTLRIPSGVRHRVTALEDSYVFDVFTPVREDWLDGTDTYFHEPH